MVVGLLFSWTRDMSCLEGLLGSIAGPPPHLLFALRTLQEDDIQGSLPPGHSLRNFKVESGDFTLGEVTDDVAVSGNRNLTMLRSEI